MLKLWRCRKSPWRCRKNHSGSETQVRVVEVETIHNDGLQV